MMTDEENTTICAAVASVTVGRVSALISCAVPPIYPSEPRTLKTVRIKVEKCCFNSLRAPFSDSPVCFPI